MPDCHSSLWTGQTGFLHLFKANSLCKPGLCYTKGLQLLSCQEMKAQNTTHTKIFSTASIRHKAAEPRIGIHPCWQHIYAVFVDGCGEEHQQHLQTELHKPKLTPKALGPQPSTGRVQRENTHRLAVREALGSRIGSRPRRMALKAEPAESRMQEQYVTSHGMQGMLPTFAQPLAAAEAQESAAEEWECPFLYTARLLFFPCQI
eukprot:1160118-Pelagomonas_calceolata.AAC.4